jgi:hypothetical protein
MLIVFVSEDFYWDLNMEKKNLERWRRKFSREWFEDEDEVLFRATWRHLFSNILLK